MAKPILVEIFGDASQFNRELDKAAGSSRRFGRVASVLGGVLATGVAIGLEKSVKAAIDAQASTARLETAFHNAGLSASDYSKQIDKAEASGRQLGFTDEQVKESLGSLVAATRDVGAATTDMATAMDLARFKHVDLESATKMLTMAMTGSQRAVKQLGIVVVPVTDAVDALKRSTTDLTTETGRAELKHAQLLDKMATGQQVIAKTSALVAGQGETFSKTAAGGIAQFQAALTHLEVTIGTKLLPALTQLLQKAIQATNYLSATFGPAVGTLSEAMSHLGGVANVLMFIWEHSLNPLRLLKLEMQAATIVARGIASVYNAIAAALRAIENAAHAVASALNSIHVPSIHLPGFLGGGGKQAFGGGKAVGGAIAAGTRYLVGEHGPEMFMSGSSGSIIPNNMLAAAGGIIDLTINLDGETIYRNQKKYAARDVRRNGGTGIMP